MPNCVNNQPLKRPRTLLNFRQGVRRFTVRTDGDPVRAQHPLYRFPPLGSVVLRSLSNEMAPSWYHWCMLIYGGSSRCRNGSINKRGYALQVDIPYP